MCKISSLKRIKLIHIYDMNITYIFIYYMTFLRLLRHQISYTSHESQETYLSFSVFPVFNEKIVDFFQTTFKSHIYQSDLAPN